MIEDLYTASKRCRREGIGVRIGSRNIMKRLVKDASMPKVPITLRFRIAVFFHLSPLGPM